MDSLKAVLFGRNLVTGVLSWFGYSHNEHTLLVGHRQAELLGDIIECDISRSVVGIINTKYEVIREMYSEFQSHENWKDPSYFGSRILQAAPTFFQRGYSAENFLAFCAMVSGVVVFYFDEEINCPEFPNIGGNIIGLVLTGHIMNEEFSRGGSWERLYAVAEAVGSNKSKQET